MLKFSDPVCIVKMTTFPFQCSDHKMRGNPENPHDTKLCRHWRHGGCHDDDPGCCQWRQNNHDNSWFSLFNCQSIARETRFLSVSQVKRLQRMGPRITVSNQCCFVYSLSICIHTRRPRQNGRHFTEPFFKLMAAAAAAASSSTIF